MPGQNSVKTVMTDPNAKEYEQQKAELIKLLETLSKQSKTQRSDIQVSDAEAKQLADKLKKILKRQLN